MGDLAYSTQEGRGGGVESATATKNTPSFLVFAVTDCQLEHCFLFRCSLG